MNKRPELNRQLNTEDFRTYYFLKEELTAFCRKNGLSASGSKAELTDRITHFLDTGESLSISRVNVAGKAERNQQTEEITADTLIESNFICTERHRAFFEAELGKSFHFYVGFQKWLKGNSGKTYAQAIEAYGLLLKEKKNSKSEIGSQFEYNTYIRDFFESNPGKSLQEAIKCWKYKKSLQGHNRYEGSDLSALS